MTTDGKKKNKTMADFRREQAQRMGIVAKMYRRGYTYEEIRREVMYRCGRQTYSLATVKKDVGRLQKEWLENRMDDYDEMVQLELERINELLKEAWKEWEAEKDTRCLEIINKAQQERRKLLGLYKPEKREVKSEFSLADAFMESGLIDG